MGLFIIWPSLSVIALRGRVTFGDCFVVLPIDSPSAPNLADQIRRLILMHLRAVQQSRGPYTFWGQSPLDVRIHLHL